MAWQSGHGQCSTSSGAGRAAPVAVSSLIAREYTRGWAGDARVAPKCGGPVLSERVLISIVVPIHSEVASLEPLSAAVRVELDRLGLRHELIFVDDGSSDGSWEALRGLSERQSGIRGLRLSRNFGKEAAVAAGLEAARGDAVLVMDGDLQHPPSLIPHLIEPWLAGTADVVEAVKVSRDGEPRARRVVSRLATVLTSWLTGTDLRGATDYKLLDRAVVERWRELGERNLFFRGMVAWLGFRHARVPFSVAGRERGESSWSFLARARLGITAVTAFSSFPLRILTVGGMLFLVLATGMALQTLYRYFAGQAVSGFATVILLTLIVGSATMIGLGVIGEYLARIYEEVKERPRFLVAEHIGSVEAETPATAERGEDG